MSIHGGIGTLGEIGDGTFTSNSLPSKTAITKVVKAGMGVGHAGALTMNGNIETWGYNNVRTIRNKLKP